MKIEGVWLPIITPFINGKVDIQSYVRLIDYYIDQGISGLIPLATTGESPTIEEDEFETVLDKTVEVVNGRIPIFVGHGGNYTKKAIKQLKVIERYKVDGILSVSPYYNLPSQEGIYEHFLQISESTSLQIMIYNIPYRTGRNIDNETIYRIAECENIVGIKDSSGNLKQSLELLLNPAPNFSNLTGEDASFYHHLTLGGSGGILASAHLVTNDFLDIFQNVKENNHNTALQIWRKTYPITNMLFQETNPAPLKYYLYKKGLIHSPETRLPVTGISKELKTKLDTLLPSHKCID
ncbi:4-hydroxy-tetrahydrodipicolinate synthase [Fictibacillus nanhaiensis]|uniref:4-hydroxy-tetrahydrodipicolinate synthase n=1 Tax=Fictibacillus nanhaiensis TaxID=742169 RepID=UPI001C98BF49|nr:4-hydroxy-tetrahydrodipicolinate synthase [Fictibacillus nanhaiensis]MBY6036923.1 4-hydroxy-tetrahydrodipicolinate synthase [Fictibacillus nanhaiensis]